MPDYSKQYRNIAPQNTGGYQQVTQTAPVQQIPIQQDTSLQNNKAYTNPLLGKDLEVLFANKDSLSRITPDSVQNSLRIASNPMQYMKGFVQQTGRTPGDFINNSGNGIEKEYMDIIDKGSWYLDPYRQAGQVGIDRMLDGNYDPGQFNYSGMNAPDKFSFQGQAPDRFSYQGQGAPSSFNYQGKNIGNVLSYMGDFTNTPGYQARLAEGNKSIDRAAAQGGRFGGGQTAKELMRFGQDYASNEYGNEWNRASQLRGDALAMDQQGYGRALDKYGRDVSAYESDYNRQLGEYGQDVSRYESDYAKQLGEYGQDVNRYQTDYNRRLGEYGLEADRLNRGYTRASDLAGMGQQAATSTGAMYSGLGSQLLNQQFQKQLSDQQRQDMLAQQSRQDDASFWSGLGGLVGGGAGLLLGGPAGGIAGYTIGSGAGGAVGR